MSEDNATRPSLVSGLNELAQLIGRRDWRAAQELGQRLVAAHPTSPTAHAALGDIASARHQHREAVQWYELSVQLEANPVVQARLEQARHAVAMEQAGAEDRAVQTEGAPRFSLPIIAVAGFLAVVLIVALVAMSVVQRRSRSSEPPARSVTRPAFRPAASPTPRPAAPAATTRPTARPQPRSRPNTATTAVVPAPGPSGPVIQQRVTQSVSGPMSDRDVHLTRSLGAVTWPNGNPLGAHVQATLDPFTGYCLITAQVPRGMPRSQLFPLALDMAYKLAVTALRTDRGVTSMTIRVLVTLTDEKDKKITLVAFRGNTNRETLNYYLKRELQPDRETLWKHVFATTWWNPGVPPYESGGR